MWRSAVRLSIALTFLLSYGSASGGEEKKAPMPDAMTGPVGTAATAPAAPEPRLVSLTVTPAKRTIMKNAMIQFTATGTFSDKTTRDLTSSVKWSSSRAAIAAIDQAGLVTAGDAKGTSSITASFQGKRGSAKLNVTIPSLVSVIIMPSKPALSKGMTLQLIATGNFSDNTAQDLTNSAKWKSSNTRAMTIDPAGLVTARAVKGTATLTASVGNKRGSTTATVSPQRLLSIAVTSSATVISRGMTQQFVATGVYSDGAAKDLTSSVKWSSSDGAAATINAVGLVTAQAQRGFTTISAAFGGKGGSLTLTVEPALASIAITPADASIRQAVTIQYAAKGIFEDGSSRDLTSACSWTSAAPAAAPISPLGLATGISIGSSAITAACLNKTGSTTLTVLVRDIICPKTIGRAGDAGKLQGLVKWPSPRFAKVNSASPDTGNAVVDQVTGLMWPADSNSPGPAFCSPGVVKTGQGAVDYLACLNAQKYLGYGDWRLPGRTELFSLIDFEQSVPAPWISAQGFSNIQAFFGDEYWISSSDQPASDSGSFADLCYGVVYYDKKSTGHFVWPVRGGK